MREQLGDAFLKNRISPERDGVLVPLGSQESLPARLPIVAIGLTFRSYDISIFYDVGARVQDKPHKLVERIG